MHSVRGRDGMPAMATVTPNYDDIQEWPGMLRAAGVAMDVCLPYVSM